MTLQSSSSPSTKSPAAASRPLLHPAPASDPLVTHSRNASLGSPSPHTVGFDGRVHAIVVKLTVYACFSSPRCQRVAHRLHPSLFPILINTLPVLMLVCSLHELIPWLIGIRLP